MGELNSPYWLQYDLRFHEDPPEGGDGGSGDSEEEEESEEEESEEEEEQNVDGLKSALAKERRERRKNERDLKRLRKLEEDRANANKSEIEKATDEAKKASERATALAAKLRTNAVDTAIIRAARGDLAFADSEDAIALIPRSDLVIEQDEDDPSDIEVDEASVKIALKALLRKKPHLKAGASDDGEVGGATGGKVGSRGTRDTGKFSEEKLKELYPQLRTNSS